MTLKPPFPTQALNKQPASTLREEDLAYLAHKLRAALVEKHHERNRGQRQCLFNSETATKVAAYVRNYIARQPGGRYARARPTTSAVPPPGSKPR